MRRRAPASLSAKPVVNDRRAVPPGGRRIACRRLTIGSSTAPVVFDSGPPPLSAAGLASVRPRPMNRARSVSYSVARADAAAAAEHVDEVDAVGARPRTARAEQRIPLGHGRGLDEEVAERRMREVGAGRGEHDFGVAGQIEAARPMAVVGDRDAPQLGVVFGRDDDLGARFEARRRRAARRRGRARTWLRTRRRRGPTAGGSSTRRRRCRDRARRRNCPSRRS